MCLNAQGSTYTEYSNCIELNIPDLAITLKGLCHTGTNKLNSRKVINKFISSLYQIPQYQNASISRNMEAVTLDLSSYKWSFDIVPGFFTNIENNLRDYYLIPDGKGNWKKTDPRIDRDRVANINQNHDGNVLNVIRAMKYWNKRPTMPTMPPYLLETMILKYYEQKTIKAVKFVDIETTGLVNYIMLSIQFQVSDPKGIQGDINTLSKIERDALHGQAVAEKIQVSARRPGGSG